MASGGTRGRKRPPGEGLRTPEAAKLSSAETIEPFEQGGLDYLCGLYAGINGLQLLVPFGSDEDERLFRLGVRYLEAEQALAKAVLGGMSLAIWRALIGELAAAHARRRGRGILVVQPFRRRRGHDLAELLGTIERAICRQSPVLVLVRGSDDHFTVIVGIDARQLTLFDSYGYKRLKKRECGLDDDEEARHRLVITSTLILEVVDD